MTSRPIVILVTGDPVPSTRARRGGYANLIRECAPTHAAAPWQEVDVRAIDVVPDLTEASAVIVTGSAASVLDREPWIERTGIALAGLVRAEVPLLGICFGHQLLGVALGGRVSRNPLGREMGTVQFELSRADPVLGDPGLWPVNSTHVDSVVELPRGAQVLGATRLDPTAAARFGPRAWGVQFHPEIDASVLSEFLQARREMLEAEGFPWRTTLESLRDAPRAAGVIERFLACRR